MRKNIGKRIVLFVMMLSLLLTMSPLTGLAAPDSGDQDTSPRFVSEIASGQLTSASFDPESTETGFEQRDRNGWTTPAEEAAFLEAVAAESERMTYSVVGTSVEGRPIHLVRLGYPEPPSDEEIAAGRNILIQGTPHGNEPAGQEAALQLLRDLAFTEDPELLEQLSNVTILFMPIPNPDGREANTRGNAWGVDNNRDHLNLNTPEIQTVARVMNQFRPDITIDAHERPSGSSPELEMVWPRNLNIDEPLRELSKEMVQDYMMPDVEEAGFTTGIYGSPTSSTNGNERVLSNMLGLRHGIGVITESAGRSTPKDRVAMQKSSFESVMRFYRERGGDIVQAVSEAPQRRADDGANQEPFYLDGADNRQPPDWAVLDPAPCGYLLNTSQAERISRHIELFSLETEKVSENGVYVPMNQPMMTVVPFLLDERARYNEVDGLALYDCSDPGSVEPPTTPEPTEPAQYETDFAESEVGMPPDNWSSLWRDSSWTVLDEPSRLEHVVGDDGRRRGLTWDEVGEVRGDVEVSGVVRASGVNDTVFQLGLHMSGEAGSEDFYYVDMRSSDASTTANRVRLNRVQDGTYTLLRSVELPFTVEENTWYHVVLQREGNLLHAKVWPYGEDEPAQWQVTTVDSSFNDGRVGVSHFNSGTVNEWAFIGVGTGGEPAPRAPDDLLPEVDKSFLQNRVNEINAENLNEENYTEESWQALQQALAAAENVLNDPEATQADVDAALAALNEARAGLEATETPPISATSMITSVEHFAESGAFESDQAARSLKLHLTAVNHYEEQGQAEKVVKHMEGFKQLLDYQKQNELISEEAYNSLYSDAESLIEKWQ